jgi:MFS family permease
LTHILPAELLLGLGMGAVFVPAFSTATTGVTPREAGVASAVANTAQQIGASLGTALLNTIAATATASFVATHLRAGRMTALVHGYAAAAGWAALVLLTAAVLVALLVNAGRPEPVGVHGQGPEGSDERVEPGVSGPSRPMAAPPCR